MTAQEIKAIIEKEEYYCYGIRMDDYNYNVNDVCHNSHNWWQDDPEDGSEYNADMGCWDGGELDGTCAFRVDSNNINEIIRIAKEGFCYYPNMYLIAGDCASNGNDYGEIVIEEAKVMAVIQKKDPTL